MLFRKNKNVHSQGKVILDDRGFIRLEVSGHASAKIVDGPQGTTVKVNKYIKQLKAEQKTVNLLMNVKKVISTDSVSRNHVMTLGERGVERIAVVGVNRVLRPIVPYILRVLNKTTETKFFADESDAIHWLIHKKVSPMDSIDTRSFAVPLFIIVLISLTTLYGWATNNEILKSFIPSSLPFNPVTAVLSAALGAGLLIYFIWHSKHRAEWAVAIPATAVVVIGILDILRITTGIDTHIDQVLFSNQADIYLDTSRSKIGLSISSVVLGTLALSALTKRKSWFHRHMFYPLLYLLGLIAVLVLIAHGFNLIDPEGFVKFTFVDALVLALFSYSLNFLGPKVGYASKLLKTTQRQWPAIVVFLAVFTATCIGWQYTNAEIDVYSKQKTESQYKIVKSEIEDRIDGYIESLYSVRAFFYGSSEVDASGFRNYLVDSDLIQSNPGLSSVAYIKYLQPSQIAMFEIQMKTQAPKSGAEYKNYKVFPVNDDEVALAVAYAYIPANNKNSIYGYNLASNPARSAVLTDAIRTGEAKSTGTINLNDSKQPGPDNIPGYFITVPLYRDTDTLGEPKTAAERETRISGFINGYFSHDVMFKEILAKLPGEILNDDHVSIKIRDSSSGEVLYKSNNLTTRTSDTRRERQQKVFRGNIDRVGSSWTLSVTSLPGYAVPEGAKRIPYITLAGGLLLAIITTATVVRLGLTRERAVEIARQMTEDLSQERNAAVENQKKEEAILASIGDAVFAIDADQKIVVFNPSTERLTGYDEQDVIGQPYKEVLKFVYDGTDKENVGFIERALHGHMSSMNEHTILITRRGKRIPVADSAAPIKDSNGNITGVTVVFRDITESRALDRSKDEFVSVASHQLRTPLSAMGWYTEMLLNGDAGKITRKQEDYLKEIYSGNKRMTELVGLLLDTSRLDLGKLDSKPEDVDLKELLASLQLEMQPYITQKHIKYVQSFTTNKPILFTDTKLIRMILQNILSNAFKYTPEKGSVELQVADIDTETHKPKMRFTVTDNGYGIPAAQQSKLFNKMFRAENVLNLEGTGLGLYIVREAVHKLGGEVTFTSVEKEGTTFIIDIPIKQSIIPPRAKEGAI